MNQPKKHLCLSPLIFLLLFPAVTLYYEWIFNLTTAKNLFHWGTLVTILFSVGYGLVLYLPLSFLPNQKARHVTVTVLLALGTIPYLIEAFVYQQFKIYYDLNTIFYGSADAVGEFSGDIILLIFSPSGLLKVILFALPALLCGFFGKKLFHHCVANGARRIIAAVGALICFGLALALTLIVPVARSVFKTEYNYQSAVEHFGLTTGLFRDISYSLSGSSDGGFEVEEAPSMPITMPELPQTETQEEETTTEEVVIEYGYNQMNLDLSAERDPLPISTPTSVL